MSKIINTVGVVVLSAAAFMFTAQPAFAEDSYVSDAVDGLSDSSVYVDSDVSLSNQGQIQSELEGSDVSVVVLPPLATETYTPNDIAGMIRSETGDDTIVVVIDNTGSGDRIGVSSANNQAEIATIINEGLAANGGDAGETLTTTIQDLKSLSESGGSPGSVGGGGFDASGLLVLPALLVFGAAGFIAYRVSRKRRNTRENTGSSAGHTTVPATKIVDGMPNRLIPSLKKLNELTRSHNELTNGSLAADIKIVTDNLQELFIRLGKKGTDSQQRIAEVEYADKLPKLIEALDTNYYIDIVKNPNLWDNSNERLAAVVEAVKAVQQELVQNIRKVNASKDLEFQVALDSLVRSVHTPTVNDIYNNKS